jgi:Fic family protein
MTTDINELRSLMAALPENSPDRQAAEVLTNALEQGRITDSECAKIFGALTHTQAQTTHALREANQYMKKYFDVAEELMEVRHCAGQAIAWLNDPLVKPVFVLSLWIEAGLNWLLRRKEVA